MEVRLSLFGLSVVGPPEALSDFCNDLILKVALFRPLSEEKWSLTFSSDPLVVGLRTQLEAPKEKGGGAVKLSLCSQLRNLLRCSCPTGCSTQSRLRWMW